MRCRDVKRRLNEAGCLDTEIQEHLRECPECGSEYEALKTLDSAFETARSEEGLPQTPFNDLKTALEQLSPQVKENSIMAKIKNKINRHPRFSFGIAISIFVFAFIILVPISYEKTVGYELALSGIGSGDSTNKEMAADIVTALGYGEAAFSFEVDGNRVKYHIRGIPSKKAAKEISSAISSLLRSTS
ncbi:MAG: zf-HC2 domain-containing protein, partial [Candidatus Zixiibacteriota bacterium]